MARPDVSAYTERLYNRLPQLYRDGDEAQADGPNGYPLLRWLSLLGDLAGELETLYDRLNYLAVDEGGDGTSTSDLIDPATADAAWLMWLAQLVGINVDRITEERSYRATYGSLGVLYPTVDDLAAAADTYAELAALTATSTGGTELTADELRQLIAGAAVAWRAGSTSSVVDVVKVLLTGTKRVGVNRHVDGDPWKVTVHTYAAETPDPFAIPGLLERSNVTPAGVELTYETLDGATYAELALEFPDVDDMTGTGLTYAELAAYVPTY